jgi:hypothetical protein
MNVVKAFFIKRINQLKLNWSNFKSAYSAYKSIRKIGRLQAAEKTNYGLNSYVFLCYSYDSSEKDYVLKIDSSESELKTLGLVQQYLNEARLERIKSSTGFYAELDYLLQHFPHMEIRQGSKQLSYGIFLWKDLGVLYLPKNLYTMSKTELATLKKVAKSSKLEIKIYF